MLKVECIVSISETCHIDTIATSRLDTGTLDTPLGFFVPRRYATDLVYLNVECPIWATTFSALSKYKQPLLKKGERHPKILRLLLD